MSKEEKKNVIIALCLCLAAVIVLWLWGKHGGSLMAAPASTDTGINPLTATSAPDPSYATYNIPPFNPAPINVLGPQGLGPLSSGGDCCDKCGPNGNAGNMNVNTFNALI